MWVCAQICHMLIQKPPGCSPQGCQASPVAHLWQCVPNLVTDGITLTGAKHTQRSNWTFKSKSKIKSQDAIAVKPHSAAP